MDRLALKNNASRFATHQPVVVLNPRPRDFRGFRTAFETPFRLEDDAEPCIVLLRPRRALVPARAHEARHECGVACAQTTAKSKFTSLFPISVMLMAMATHCNTVPHITSQAQSTGSRQYRAYSFAKTKRIS